jgi:hypothetical protein
MQGQEPTITQSDPKAYYLYLQTQGMSPVQAVQLVQQRFGAPKSPDEIARERASQNQQNALLQSGGQIAGTLLATKGIPYIAGQLGMGSTAAGTGAVAMPTALGGAGALGGTAGAGAAGAGTAGVGAAGAGAGTAGAGAAGATSLGSIGAVALPAAAIAIGLNNMWETGMKDIVRGRGDRSDWINQGVNVLGGGLPNIALRLMGKRSIGKMATTGKSDAQLLRDDFRGLLKQTGVADNDYNVTLADGSQFNIGLDGKTKYKNSDGETTRRAWDVDFTNPYAKYAVNVLDPMIRNIYQGADGQLNLEQYTGMLVNAATSNAKSEDEVRANINAMLGKSTFAKQAGVALPEMPKGQQVAPIAKTPQVSTPEGRAKSMSIRDVLQQNINKQ